MKRHRFAMLAFPLLILPGATPDRILAQAEQSGLPVQYEELTATDFAGARDRAKGVCLVPLGILEKHGPHLPVGTDLLNSRELALRAARKEYCVVFPPYYVGQIFEAKHQPGAIAYSTDLIWMMLRETCDELARNGFSTIVLVNGHGGNNSFLQYFCQAQLESPRDYAVVLFTPGPDTAVAERVRQLRKTTSGGHADEEETSMLMTHRPDLVHRELGKAESGEDMRRLSMVPYGYTGIWWYARYPNHYAGDGSHGSKELGDILLSSRSDRLAELVRTVKRDPTIRNLQHEFYKRIGENNAPH